VNNDSHSSNKIIEIDLDSNSLNSCEIIDEHHETTGIEVNVFTLFIS